MTLLSQTISESGMDTDANGADDYVVLVRSGSGDWTALISGEGVTKAYGMTKKTQTPIALAAMSCLAAIHTSSLSGRNNSLERSVIRLLRKEQERLDGGRKEKKTRSGSNTKKK